MVLYTCNQKKVMPFAHPCGKAAKALDEAGVKYELQTVAGYRALPWTKKGGARDEIRRLTGQENVPVLVLDDGETIAGSGKIADWAKSSVPSA